MAPRAHNLSAPEATTPEALTDRSNDSAYLNATVTYQVQ